MKGLDSNILWYPCSEGIEAFSTMRDAVLPYPVVTGHQVHGFKVARVTSPDTTRDELSGIDALVTDLPGCAIGVRTADCIPVLLHDPVHKAVAAIHSGWKGTVQKICLCTILRMSEEFGTEAKDLRAIIGPGISLKNFQVRDEVPQLFKEAGFPIERLWQWMGRPEDGNMKGGHHLNLADANRWLLEESGVKPENIFDCGICTYDDVRFFSARREGFDCGRIINSIKLI